MSRLLKLAPACFRSRQKRAVPAQWQDNFSYSLFPKKLSGGRKHLSLGCLEPQKIHSLNYRFGYKHAIIQPRLTARMVSSMAGNTYSSAREGGIVDYYVIEVSRWCIALHRETWMRLTYRRDYLPERELWRDFLVSAEPLPGTNERRLQ